MADNIRMDRRGFVAGLAGVYAVSSVTFAADVGSTSVVVGGISYSRTIPIKMKTDVFIAGGGSAAHEN